MGGGHAFQPLIMNTSDTRQIQHSPTGGGHAFQPLIMNTSDTRQNQHSSMGGGHAFQPLIMNTSDTRSPEQQLIREERCKDGVEGFPGM